MPSSPFTSLVDHPRAAPAIRRVKAGGGLAGFGLAVVVGLGNGEPFSTILLRGVELGLVANLVVWAAAVVVWKRLLAAEATAAVRQLKDRRLAASAEKAE